MNSRYYLPFLFIAISFTACVERTKTIESIVHEETIAPEYSIKERTLKSRISAVIPADEISFSSSKTQIVGESEINILLVEIVSKRLPSNLISFYRVADDIQEAVKSGLINFEDYQKLKIEVRRTYKENGVDYDKSYKKEFDL